MKCLSANFLAYNWVGHKFSLSTFTRVNISGNWYQSIHSLVTNTTPEHQIFCDICQTSCGFLQMLTFIFYPTTTWASLENITDFQSSTFYLHQDTWRTLLTMLITICFCCYFLPQPTMNSISILLSFTSRVMLQWLYTCIYDLHPAFIATQYSSYLHDGPKKQVRLLHCLYL